MDSNGATGHAIVIGGSMAGLLCARVLANHYQEVTILERDSFPAIGDQRRGVPQGRHSHALLASGRRVIEHLFPGILHELACAGALTGDIATARWFNEGGCLIQFDSGLEGILCSRPFLEGHVRRRLLNLPNIRARENAVVEELAANPGNARVNGIKMAGETIPADLVVDTTGRGSHSPQWLETLGYPKPREERVEIAVAYTTRMFRRQDSDLDGDKGAIIPPTPTGKRGGVMLAQEGHRWTVTLVGHFGQAAPPELEGFIEYAGSIPAPYIYDVVREAEPLGEPAVARFPASVRRRYEKLPRFPEGYLVFGDAIASFNPIYGQGMSVSALEASELDAALAENREHLSKRFFGRASKIVDNPWSIAVGNDLRMPETVGPRNAGIKFINWYMAKLNAAAHRDQIPALAFHRVANLLAPPASVLHPAVAWRVLLSNLSPTSVSSRQERTGPSTSAAE